MDNNINRYQAVIDASQVTTDDAAVQAAVDKILNEHYSENCTPEIYQFLLNCVDLTTLGTEDSESSVAKFVQRVNAFDEHYPQYKNVAAICVYSNFAAVVRSVLEVSDVNIAVCSACFPSSQAHIETKVAETALAVEDGTDEVDIVINVGYLRDGAYEELCDEIALINKSKVVVNGPVEEIRRNYGSNNVELIYTSDAPVASGDFFTVLSDSDDSGRHTAVISLDKDADTNAVLQALISQNIRINSFKELLPRMNDIFIKLVTEGEGVK